MEQYQHNASEQKNIKPTSEILIRALCEPTVYDHDVNTVKVIETHISWVLLTGKYAYKIKKPVNFGFLDFSTLKKRHFYCAEELRLNRRLAADLYLDVVAITGTPAAPKINGSGSAFEYAVKMHQFPPHQLLGEFNKHRQLQANMIDQMTNIIADFHNQTAIAKHESPYGNAEDIQNWFLENFKHIKPLLHKQKYHLKNLQKIKSWGETEWKNKSDFMRKRKRLGFVRECHGDLHLDNMAMIDGQITLFDCIEFNPKLRWIDVISEVAFVFMDLQHRGRKQYAFRFLNLYLQKTGDYQGLALLRYYYAYRALVRAKVTLLRMDQYSDEQNLCSQTFTEYKVYINLIKQFYETDRTFLIITHGYSGSGKSTISAELGESIGAIVIRSDIERKRLYGIKALDHSNSGIDSGLYTKNAGQLTYQQLADLAASILMSGFPTIIDATFLKAEQRQRFRNLANVSGVPFYILDFKASEEELQKRIIQRQEQAGDASEATLAVLQQQSQYADPLSPDESNFLIEIDTSKKIELEAIAKKINEH